MINLLYFNISAKGLFQEKTWWNRDYVVDTKVHVFFLKKAFGRNIEIE